MMEKQLQKQELRGFFYLFQVKSSTYTPGVYTITSTYTQYIATYFGSCAKKPYFYEAYV